MTIDTIPTGHAGESPGGFGAEGVCCESRIRVRESGKERDHIQGKLKGDSYTATTELWPQLSTETLLLTFPDDATVNQFSAAVTKIKENKVDQFIKSQVKCWLHCNELKILKWYFHQTPSMFSERTEESSASQWAASHLLNFTTSFLFFWDYPLKKCFLGISSSMVIWASSRTWCKILSGGDRFSPKCWFCDLSFYRTSTYQKAILDNPTDFAGKVIKNTLVPKKMEDSNAASGRDGRRSWFWNPFLLRPAGWR